MVPYGLNELGEAINKAVEEPGPGGMVVLKPPNQEMAYKHVIISKELAINPYAPADH